eukprot:TRINITY_DN5551_c0_g1_i1.p1 TRINITY_DN5551_c0_g1~~TRINITY_DN5551_c0_g1_i1.p1  ORF type:complete len:364 (-),score=47.75 TRINITY_DN5551_c0_g1_i1:10-1011(-)
MAKKRLADSIPERSDDGSIGILMFYSSLHAHSTVDQWMEKIGAQQISVNGDVTTDPLFAIKSGDILEYKRPAWIEPAIPISSPNDLKIIFEDSNSLVIDKPSGLPVLPGGQFSENTLICFLRRRYPELDFVSPIHRLGRGTSGAILFAKNSEASKVLCRAFRDRNVSKKYLAVLSGTDMEDTFTIRAEIGKIEFSQVCKETGHLWAAVEQGGKASLSHFRVLYRCERTVSTLCEVEIETGRAHQIRIHSAYSTHPLVGDPLYISGGIPISSDHSGIPPSECGYLLHSHKLSFPSVEIRDAKGLVGGEAHIVCHMPRAFFEHFGRDDLDGFLTQ